MSTKAYCIFCLSSFLYLSCLSQFGRRARACLLRENDAHNETIKTKRLCENENQHHGHEQLGLDAVRSHACVADNANGDTGAEARETAGQAGGKVGEAREGGVRLRLDGLDENDGNNQTINTLNK